MRETRNAQASIFEFYAEHEFGVRLSRLSDLLDAHPEILELIAKDLIDPETTGTGALRFERGDCVALLVTQTYFGG